MADPRIREYAKLLVDTCVGVQKGWEVVVVATPLGRPLVEAVTRRIGEREAYAILRLNFSGALGLADVEWAKAAPESILGEPASIERYTLEHTDAAITILAPENTREASAVAPERLASLQRAYRPSAERLFSGDVPWVGCHYPCPALAQDAEMSLAEFEDFIYGSVLLDWEGERRRMQRIANRFDAADIVRIVGEGTDLTLSLAGRQGHVDAAGANMPGGEVFYSPREDSAEGEIAFTEFPSVRAGREIPGIRFRFERGRIVDASAERNEEFLIETLDTDDGARCLGELGIGCNPGITRYMRNPAFDEKIDGTIHVAVGNGFPFIGGMNVSAIHWDIVKDLRRGGELYCDGDLVQRGGEWLL